MLGSDNNLNMKGFTFLNDGSHANAFIPVTPVALAMWWTYMISYHVSCDPSYNIISYPIVSYVASYRIVTCHVLSSPLLSSPLLFYPTLSYSTYHITSYHTSHHIISYIFISNTVRCCTIPTDLSFHKLMVILVWRKAFIWGDDLKL